MWKERTMPIYFVKACARLVVDGTTHACRQNALSADMRLLGVEPPDVHDRMKWRATVLSS